MALGESFQFEIGANIRQAREQLDALSGRLRALRGDAAEVANTDVDVQVDDAEIERAIDAVEDLRQTAGRGIDLNIDPGRSAARTAEDVRRMQVNAEGIQRGIGPLRGFTDELGGASAAGGVAANAIIDAGEAIEIFGAQLGFSQEKLARWSLALGGIGIALGIAIPLIKSLADGQDEVAEATQKANDRLKEQTGLLDQIETRLDNQPSIVDALLPEEERNDLIRAFQEVGIGVDQLASGLIAANTSSREFAAQRLELAGVARDEADSIAEALVKYREFDAVLLAVNNPDTVKRNEQLIESLIRISEAANGIDENQALRDFVADVNNFGSPAQIEAVAAALERLADAPVAEQLAGAAEAFEAAGAGGERVIGAAEMIQREIDLAASNMRRFGTDGVEQMGAVEEATGRVVSQLGFVEQLYGRITGRFSEESQLIGIVEQFQKVMESAGEVAAAQADDSKDAAEAALEHRKNLLQLGEQVVRYAREVDDIPPQKVTDLVTAIDQGNLLDVQRLLEELTADRDIRIRLAVDNPGEVKFLIDPDGGAPTLVSGSARPTVTSTPFSTQPNPDLVQQLIDGVNALGRSSQTTNIFTLGPDPVPAIRDYEFGNGAR